MDCMKTSISGWKSHTSRILKARTASWMSWALRIIRIACFATGRSCFSCSMGRCDQLLLAKCAAQNHRHLTSFQMFHFPCLSPHSKPYLSSFTEWQTESKIFSWTRRLLTMKAAWPSLVSSKSKQIRIQITRAVTSRSRILIQVALPAHFRVNRTVTSSTLPSSPRATTT